ncbi:MAG: DUF4912 domain-containing protein [Syntrophothermus sp.]
MTKSELIQAAQELDIGVPENIGRDELVELIRDTAGTKKSHGRRPFGTTKIWPAIPAEGAQPAMAGPGPTPGQHLESGYELPPGYGDTKIVAMVRDPYWLHTYWEISDSTIAGLRQELGPSAWEASRMILRVYDISGINTEQIAAVSFNPSLADRYFDIVVNPFTNNWYVDVGVPNRSYCIDLGVITQDGRFIRLARSNSVITPRAGVSEIIDEEWLTLDEIYGYTMRRGYGFGQSSIELMQPLARRLAREMGSGAVSSISSWGRQPPVERPFWLTVHTELIVHGATEPDAKVIVAGQEVRLRPDGTFTLRFALPDGERAIPVAGTSAHTGETIVITPVVAKHTH